MKNTITSLLFCLLATLFLHAESIPTGYYNRIDGQSGQALMDSLTRIIGDTASPRIHYGTWGYVYDPTTKQYTGERYEGTWSYFPVTDQHQNGTVWDMYSPYNRYYPENYGSGCNLNIEHCLPNSWWGKEAGNKRAYSDLYELNPSDAKANQTGKSSYPLGVVDSTVSWTNGFCRRGLMKGHGSQLFFEPADVYKGDFARTWFYVLTCYRDSKWQGDALKSGALDTTSHSLLSPWMRDILLQWHRQDPVSQKEIDRQDQISSIQHNRNPFIDYPELVEYIWGNYTTSTLLLPTLQPTTSPSYLPEEDYTDLQVLPAEDVTASGFTARWKAWNEPLQLEIYQRTQALQQDTLFALGAVTQKIIDATANIRSNGNLNTTAAGNSACLMGKSSNDGAIYLTGRQYPAGAQLKLRVSKYYNATSAQLKVSAGQTLLKDTTWTSGDEFDWTISLPQATDSITIQSVGGSTSKRADMLRIYVLQPQQQEVLVPLYSGEQSAGTDAYSFSATGAAVNTALPIIYRLRPQAGLATCEEEVMLEQPTSLTPSETTSGTRKVFRQGRVLIEHNGQWFDVLGVPVNN